MGAYSYVSLILIVLLCDSVFVGGYELALRLFVRVVFECLSVCVF